MILSSDSGLQAAADHYLALAGEIARGGKPALILMHGFSGAGKSRVAAALAEALGGIRLRSDVERKRLFGLDATARSHSSVNAGIYDREAGAKTYARLAELAETVLKAGYPAIVDAAFLARWQRQSMHKLASKLGEPLGIVDCTADNGVLRERVIARAARGSDVSEAALDVLEHQMTAHEPLTTAEQEHLVRCDMEGSEADRVAACVTGVLRHLNAG